MLSLVQVTELAIPVLRLAIAAGAEIMDVYRSDDFEVEHKADLSPLTRADRRSHDVIDAGLAQLTPETHVLSEEGRHIPYVERAGWNELWLVDPLDGTKEFIKRNGEFTVNIGLVQNRQAVFGVVYSPVCGVAYMGIPTRAGSDEEPGQPRGTVFPAPGAYRFVLADANGKSTVRPNTPDEELARRAEPISGAEPFGKSIRIIASRSHMGLRTKAFVKTIGESFREVKFTHIGSSLKLCLLAEGSAHIYPRIWPTMEWDTAAGHAVVRAAGGEIWKVPHDGRRTQPDWLAKDPAQAPPPESDRTARALARAAEVIGAQADEGGEASLRDSSVSGHFEEGGVALGEMPRRGVGVAGKRARSHGFGDERPEPLQYNKRDLRNPHFVARGW